METSRTASAHHFFGVALGFLLLALAAGAPMSTAQTEPLRTELDFTFLPESTLQFVTIVGTANGPGGGIIGPTAAFRFAIKDNSVDAVTGGTPAKDHYITFSVRWVGDNPEYGVEWQFVKAMTDPLITFSGRTTPTQDFLIQHQPSVTTRIATAEVTARMSLRADPTIFVERSINFTAYIYPNPGLLTYLGSAGGNTTKAQFAPTSAGPNSWISIPFTVVNPDLYEQKIDLTFAVKGSEGVNPDQIPYRGQYWDVLQPLEIKSYTFEVRTPKSQFWYSATPMQYTITASNGLQPGIASATSGVVLIQGFYYSTQLLVMTPLLVFLVAIFLLFLFRAGRYFNEKVLGRPIPPWRIKEEAEALNELRKTDSKAYYVRRFFLMEDEYRSALLWFHFFKKRNKRQIRREATAVRLKEKAAALKTPSLVRFDRKAERLKQKFHRRQERQKLRLEATLEKLQEKVDRHFEEDFDKDHAKWEAKVEKLKKKANRPWYRAHKKWESQVEKILDKWEKPFAKEKARAEKAMDKAREKYAAKVKKGDKPAWKEWREKVEETERENKVRDKEGREPMPVPIPVSAKVEAPEWPKPFKEPPRPKLPAEPKPPRVEGLPPEPKLTKPTLEASHYAKKAQRERRGTERKVRRLERRLNRLLAKNERNRYRALAGADRKRRKMLRDSERIFQPTPLQRLLRLTPQDRERRANRKLVKALAKERLDAFKEAEDSRLGLLEVDLRRRQAEATAKLARDRAEARLAGETPQSSEASDGDLAAMEEQSLAKLEQERAASQRRIAAERIRLRAELEGELAKQAAATEPAKAQASKSKNP